VRVRVEKRGLRRPSGEDGEGIAAVRPKQWRGVEAQSTISSGGEWVVGEKASSAGHGQKAGICVMEHENNHLDRPKNKQ
jgi:hypothetical protein